MPDNTPPNPAESDDKGGIQPGASDDKDNQHDDDDSEGDSELKKAFARRDTALRRAREAEKALEEERKKTAQYEKDQKAREKEREAEQRRKDEEEAASKGDIERQRQLFKEQETSFRAEIDSLKKENEQLRAEGEKLRTESKTASLRRAFAMELAAVSNDPEVAQYLFDLGEFEELTDSTGRSILRVKDSDETPKAYIRKKLEPRPHLLLSERKTGSGAPQPSATGNGAPAGSVTDEQIRKSADHGAKLFRDDTNAAKEFLGRTKLRG